jgi:hypothetical protein
MAELRAWQEKVSEVQNNLTELDQLVTTYTSKTKPLDDLVKQVRELQEEKANLEREAYDADQEASTLDRDFLDKKETFPDPFKPSKIYTLQDFTLYFFFVSYVLFVLGVVMTVQEKTKVLLAFAVLTFLMITLFYRYL